MVLSIIIINYIFCGQYHNSILSILWDLFVDPIALLCLFILIGDFVLDIEGTVWNLAEGRLNALSVLSLFPLSLNASFQVV